jgi:serine protein kinase
MWTHSRQSHPEEGLTGVSPRFVINAISNAIIRSDTRSLTSMDVLLALKDAIEATRAWTPSRRSSGSISGHRAQGLLQPLGQGRRAPGAVRVVRTGGAAAAGEVPGRGRGVARQPRGGGPHHRRVASTDERFLRSVEEKIRISESGKHSFRQEVVRKAMVAFKSGEKFTLDSHSGCTKRSSSTCSRSGATCCAW